MDSKFLYSRALLTLSQIDFPMLYVMGFPSGRVEVGGGSTCRSVVVASRGGGAGHLSSLPLPTGTSRRHVGAQSTLQLRESQTLKWEKISFSLMDQDRLMLGHI